ncbi:MAG: hypothetical protein ACRDUX_39885 [Mycobacterium sp.]
MSLWPGSTTLTSEITRFAALEGRVFSLAVSGRLTRDDIPDDFPLAEELRAAARMSFTAPSFVVGATR